MGLFDSLFGRKHKSPNDYGKKQDGWFSKGTKWIAAHEEPV